MKLCYIKRIEKDKPIMYFNKHLGFYSNQNHWVIDEREAKQYFDGRKANGDIKKYKLKNCIVEYVKLEEVK